MITFTLFLSLFFPRIGLLIGYMFNGIPYNVVPFVIDFIMTLFIPRILIIFYCFTSPEVNVLWGVAHIIALIIDWSND